MKAGDRVVCIKTHSQGVTVKGAEYIVKGTMECVCGALNINVGIHSRGTHLQCAQCLHVRPSDGTFWQGARNFRKMDHHSSSNSDSAEIAKEAEKYIQIEKTPEKELEPIN